MDVSDEGKRASEIITLHLIANNEHVGKWVAIRLSDGGSDGVLYDSRANAIRFQLHEQQCMYVKIPPDGMPAEHATRFLEIHRMIYDAGYRLIDPDRPDVEAIIPERIEELLPYLRRNQG